jgi:alpha-beta hydrolase superfamily lysophospholipase
MNRFGFIGATAALGSTAGIAPAIAQSPPAALKAGTPAPARAGDAFFADAAMNFIFLIVLGGTYYGVGDVGTALAMIHEVVDGDSGSAYAALNAYGERAYSAADSALKAGHRISARSYYLQASNYIFASTYFCDGMGAPDKLVPTWQRSRTALDAAFALFDRPVEHVNIPYEGTTLPGYFIKPDSSPQPRPLFIIANGSDASVLDMWVQGGASAIDRGYNVLIFDGPGQGAALWLQHLHFRPDYEHVVTPVVDFALRRPDVDPKRIALQGISQGGYWAPRAMAFEHRIAAGIADGGVYDVSAAWYAPLPTPLTRLLEAGEKAAFDHAFLGSLAANPKSMADYAFRSRPFGFDSPFEVYTAVRQYTLAGLVDRITAPMLIADPENEQFFPGQPRQLFEKLPGTKKAIVRFTASEGANHHCEPAAPGLRSLRVFDWLDTTLAKI